MWPGQIHKQRFHSLRLRCGCWRVSLGVMLFRSGLVLFSRWAAAAARAGKIMAENRNSSPSVRTPDRLPGVVVTDTRGVIRSINDDALRMFGYSREELMGQNCKVGGTVMTCAELTTRCDQGVDAVSVRGAARLVSGAFSAHEPEQGHRHHARCDWPAK